MKTLPEIIDAPLAVAVPADAPLAKSGAIDWGDVLRSILASGRPMSEMKEALDLCERMEKIRRESLFNAAFAKFKRECPPIVRRTQDEYITVTRDGVRQPRMYASLHDLAAVVDPPLHSNGLSYFWSDSVLTPTGCIIRKFVLRHADGHSAEPVASPPIPIEGGEAYKAISDGRQKTSASPQQRMGVADTYAMRYSMISGLGLTTCDEDDDGAGGGEGDPITDEQARSLNDMIVQLDSDLAVAKQPPIIRPAFLGLFKVKAIAELTSETYPRAVAELTNARRVRLGEKA